MEMYNYSNKDAVLTSIDKEVYRDWTSWTL